MIHQLFLNMHKPPACRCLPNTNSLTSCKSSLPIHLYLVFCARSGDLRYYVVSNENVNEDESEDDACGDGSLVVSSHVLFDKV